MRFRLTDETPDSYNEIVESDGADINRFVRNPVMLYMHNSWDDKKHIGYWDNLKKEGDGWYADARFASTDYAQEIEAKVKSGSIRAVSIGFRIRKGGYTPATKDSPARITDWELWEASLVTFPANPNAVRVVKSGDSENMFYKVYEIPNSMNTEQKGSPFSKENLQNFFDSFEFFKSKAADGKKSGADRFAELEAKFDKSAVLQDEVDSLKTALKQAQTDKETVDKELAEVKNSHEATKKALEKMTALKEKFENMPGAKHTEAGESGGDDMGKKTVDETVEQMEHNKNMRARFGMQ